MVNFRFHLVSLTAVFLAMAIGIAVGATVVDQATVDALKSQLQRVEGRVDRTDGENARLAGELGRWNRFAQEADTEAVAQRLADVPVLVLGVRGVEREPVDKLRQSLAVARAHLQGTVWFTSRLGLAKPEDTGALAGILGIPTRSPDALRRAAVTRVVLALTREEPPGLLAALRDAAFVEFEAPAGLSVPDLSSLPLADTRFVVVSAATAEVPNEQLAVPLAAQLARQPGTRVLAAEPGREPAGNGQPGQRAVFVGQLRQDAQVAALLSTVDNLEDFRGRFAAVYALRDLGAGKVGHFGIGPRASRLVPETSS